MKQLLFFVILLLISTNLNANPVPSPTYDNYHKGILKAEHLIALENYQQALDIYEELFDSYDFVFLRDYKIATQLALHLKQNDKALQYLKSGIQQGWTKKDIKKNNFLDAIRKGEEWKTIKREYKSLRATYEQGINQKLRKQVKKMISRDQWLAFQAFLKISSKAQDRFAERKFAPHSERQLAEFKQILEDYGYPGEQLIGNDIWASTILSHHNSISVAYVQKDTLYPQLKPQLKQALLKGQVSTNELVFIDDWYVTIKDDRAGQTYGIINSPLRSNLAKTNALRTALNFRSVELRNQLVDIQNKTGMNLYLPGFPWVDGKIEFR